MKTLRTLFMGLFLVAVSITLVVAQAGAQGGGAPQDPAATNVSFTGTDGVQLNAYVATPEGAGRRPAVLMIHEWWGLNRDMAMLADALAGEGFVVLAVDAFRGAVARTAQEARSQVQGTPPAQLAADIDAALRYLRSRSDVDPLRISSLGFCFGGTQSMLLGTRTAGLAGVVIFYGGGPITETTRLGSMASNGRVLGIYGAEDAGIPVAQVRSFETALASAGVPATITVYPGVGHAFVKSNTYNQGGAPQQAWKQMLAFLR